MSSQIWMKTLYLSKKLLRKNVSFQKTEGIKNAFAIHRDKLEITTTETVRLAKPGLQYATSCDATHHSSGIVLMIEHCQKQQRRNCWILCTCVIRIKIFQCSPIEKVYKVQGVPIPLLCLGNFLWFHMGSEKPVIILTDNKSITRFFRAKQIPSYLCKYVDRVTAFNIVVTHIPGRSNAAADLLSRLQSNPNETIELKLTDRTPIRENEMNERAKLPDNTIKELFADNSPVNQLRVVDINTLITLKQYPKLWSGSDQLRKLASNREKLQLTKNNETITEINATQHTNPMDDYPELETTIANLKKEQDADPVITKLINELETESALTAKIYSTGEQKYLKQFWRLFTESGILYRRYFAQVGKMLYKELCVPKTMLK